MRKTAVLLFVFAVMLPMISYAALSAPDVLDDESIITDKPIPKGTVIGVRLFSTDDVEYENVDDEEMHKMKSQLKNYRKILAERIKDSLEGYGFKAVILKDSGNGNAGVVIEGKITMVNLGSAVGRIMFGWGAGQCGIGAEGKLVDKGGNDLAKFEHESTSGLESGFDKWQMVEKETREMGDDLAEFVDKLSK